MAYVLFISEGRLKKLTAIHENVEPDDLTPFVIQAQDLRVQELLGTKMYNNLKTKVLSGTTSSYEDTLLDDYLAPMLANWAVYYAYPNLNFKIKNKSVLNPSAEEADNTDLSTIKYLRGNIQDTAEFYTERAREFLRDNQEYFADYINPGVDGMMPNRHNPYFKGIYIPKYYGCGVNASDLPDNPNPVNN